MKRMSSIVVVASLAVVPTLGADTVNLPSNEQQTLTLFDSLPSKNQITSVTGPDPVARLRELALSPATDPGVRLRAIRALPQFCSSVPSCKDQVDHPARLAVRDVFATIAFDDRNGQVILGLRAAIESLGVIKSGQQADVDLLLPYLAHESRDIRVSTARALRDLCLDTASQALRTRYDQEPVVAVRLAISNALGDLDTCSP